jgi:hypothetical protein
MPLLLKPVEPSRGLRWIGDAFRLFGRKPLAFTALFAVFLFSASLVALVPVLGTVVQLVALPLVSLGFMVAGQSALLDGPVHPRQYIEPLRGDPQRRRALITLSLLYGLLALCILMVADAASDSAFRRMQELMAQSSGPSTPGTPEAAMAAPEGIGTAVLLVMGLGTLLSVPFWHAAALVHWGGQGVQQALFSSTVAVWRSKGAFLVYLSSWVGLMFLFGIVGATLFALLGLPQMVGVLVVPGLMVFSAVFYLSVLFTFNDSFGGSPPRAADEPPPPDA